MREVREETGLEVRVTGMLGIWMDTYSDAEGGGTPDATLNCYYHAQAEAGSAVVDPSEATEAAWFAQDALPDDIAFPAHVRQVLEVWRDTPASGRAASTGPARPG